jgi:hypothetical protein
VLVVEGRQRVAALLLSHLGSFPMNSWLACDWRQVVYNLQAGLGQTLLLVGACFSLGVKQTYFVWGRQLVYMNIDVGSHIGVGVKLRSWPHGVLLSEHRAD